MTERGTRHVRRERDAFAVGPSSLRWDGQALKIQVNEVGAPIPHRVKGEIAVYPDWLSNQAFALDTHARHHWGPIAPSARIDVKLGHPGLSWQGHAYLDSNCGSEPINKPELPAFESWDWSRTALPDGRCAVVYDVRESGGRNEVLALRFGPTGHEPFEPTQCTVLPSTRWGVARQMRAKQASVSATLEDTPFYSRSVLQTTLLGHPGLTMHESLSVPRLTSWAVQSMLPWKMPRLA